MGEYRRVDDTLMMRRKCVAIVNDSIFHMVKIV